ncbi:hypothetical protein OUZ56_033241 [Daphnia magna]|uniref:Uncharacterized protein n=1 Tax=Daphnia magna TaxID=35525 RepID=A0ABQ9ZXI8_9CRUS|nr:hypothetical protein OUZ56_033241 [Daphnia magna]
MPPKNSRVHGVGRKFVFNASNVSTQSISIEFYDSADESAEMHIFVNTMFSVYRMSCKLICIKNEEKKILDLVALR